ncbi:MULTISPECIES: hypothetical protein [Burkholderia]|uniref:hypothetical protein n=1 Tax=Burkholderia TaxID=32008 RepID=UPI000A9DB996|nr:MULTISPECIES: hypothetical protein [Burkholderia]MBG0866377.1 hypothetical protein [Burkholderia sp. 9779_493]MBG0878161.1 hypothetical protein [Burkholderia sp. 9775_39]MBG0882726.1 hypothetical protein [Burkholderia sp. 9773_38]MBO1857806.1 hypothetical protein [Burkholderia cenocepacia]MBR7944218.1 hypothetical protein [Burkholderia cenocepacia]
MKDLPRAVKRHGCAVNLGMTNMHMAAIVDKYMTDNPDRWGAVTNNAYAANGSGM